MGPLWLVTQKCSVCFGPGQKGDESRQEDQWEEKIPPLELELAILYFSAARVHHLIICLNVLCK